MGFFNIYMSLSGYFLGILQLRCCQEKPADTCQPRQGRWPKSIYYWAAPHGGVHPSKLWKTVRKRIWQGSSHVDSSVLYPGPIGCRQLELPMTSWNVNVLQPFLVSVSPPISGPRSSRVSWPWRPCPWCRERWWEMLPVWRIPSVLWLGWSLAHRLMIDGCLKVLWVDLNMDFTWI